MAGVEGRVVYTSSTAGLVAEYAGSSYTSSKHGLLGLMRSVAQDGGAYGISGEAIRVALSSVY